MKKLASWACRPSTRRCTTSEGNYVTYEDALRNADSINDPAPADQAQQPARRNQDLAGHKAHEDHLI